MALAAIEAFMFAGQDIPGEGMIEVFNTAFPPDQIAFASLMFHVAGDTVVVTDIGVQPFFQPDFAGEQVMASETFGAGDFIACIVAFAAIFQSLEIGVRLVKIAGGKLRPGINAGHKYGNDDFKK